MWGNITGAVGAAIQKVQKLQNELESQLDQAVGVDSTGPSSIPEIAKSTSSTVFSSEEETHPVPSNLTMTNDNPPHVETMETVELSRSTSTPRLKAEKTKSTDSLISTNSDTPTKKVNAKKLEMERQLASQAAEIEKQGEIIATKTNENSKLQSDLSKLVQNNKKSEKDLSSANRKLEESQQIIAKSENKISELKMLCTESEHKANEVQNKLNSLLSQEKNKIPTEQTAEYLSLAQQNKVASAQYEQQIASLKEEINSLNNSINTTKNDHKTQQSALRNKIKQLKSTNKAQEQDNETINNKLSKIQKLYGDSMKQITDLKQQLATAATAAATQSSKTTADIHTAPSPVPVPVPVVIEESPEYLELSTALEESARKVSQLELLLVSQQDTHTQLELQLASHQDTLQKVAELESQVASQKDIHHKLSSLEVQLESYREIESTLSDLQHKLAATQSDNSKLMEQISTLELTQKQNGNEISAHKLTNENNKLSGDITRLNETIANRERALETATQSQSELLKQTELSNKLNGDLKAEIQEKDAQLQRYISAQVDGNESAKTIAKLQGEIKRLQEVVAEKTSIEEAYKTEGASLARKTSEMEANVRKKTKELNLKDKEIESLKKNKEELTGVIEKQQDVIKKHESDVTNSSKSLSAMAAVSHASTEKLSRLEAEIALKTEEILSQKRALENSWNENNEAKRTIAELKADRDDLRRQIGEGTSKVMETESYRRDIEQREAVLRATSKQLQDSLQRQMQESATREERLREEVTDMRKRWQEAITSRETMSNDLGNATAPLLRQITSLQENIRIKSENWQNIESSISERALRAENLAEIADNKKAILEEQNGLLKSENQVLTQKTRDLQSNLSHAEEKLEKLKKIETVWHEEKLEFESKLALESVKGANYLTSIRELEMRHKIAIQDLQGNLNLLTTEKNLEIRKLESDVESAKQELEYVKNNYSYSSSNKKNKGGKQTTKENGSDENGFHTVSLDGDKSPSNNTYHNNHNENNGNSMFASQQNNGIMPGNLSNGETSFASTEKLQQRNYQKNEEIRILQTHIKQLEGAKKHLLDEVDLLSRENARLGEMAASVPALTSELKIKKDNMEVLLHLLGEKEEELEGALSDMKEVKLLYQSHMNELLDKIAPEQNNVTPSGSNGSVGNLGHGYAVQK